MHKIYFYEEGNLSIVLVDDNHYEEVVEGLLDTGCTLWKEEWVE